MAQAYKVLFSLDILGNPYGLGKSMVSGVRAFLDETTRGAVLTGGMRMAQHLAQGFADSTSKMTKSISSKVSQATMDRQFLQQREEWNRLEAAEMQRENEAIQRFAEEKQALERARMRAHVEQEAAKEAVRQQLGEKIAREEREQQELEQMRLELAEEEERARERQRQRQDLERRVAQQMKLRAAQEESMEELRRRREAERAEEEEFRAAMMEKFAADDRIEQMNAQKRRMRVLQHKRDVERLIEERRQRKEFEKQQVCLLLCFAVRGCVCMSVSQPACLSAFVCVCVSVCMGRTLLLLFGEMGR